MKRVLTPVLLVMAILLTMVQTAAAATLTPHSIPVEPKPGPTAVNIRVDGKGLNPLGYLEQNTSMVPVAIFTETGASVQVKDKYSSATIALGTRTVVVTSGWNKATVTTRSSAKGSTASRTVTMPLAARVYNNELFVPLAAVAEGLGMKVSWDQKTKTASVDTKVGALTVLLCTKCVLGAGHVAVVVQDADNHTYYSFASANDLPYGKGTVAISQISATKGDGLSIMKAVNPLRKKDQEYNKAYVISNVPLRAIEAGRSAMLSFANTTYNMAANNCTTSVHDTLEAAGLNPPTDYESSKVTTPNSWFDDVVKQMKGKLFKK